MIPERKKTPEEIAALREGLGIHASQEATPEINKAALAQTPAPYPPQSAPEIREAVIHLNIPPLPTAPVAVQSHSLRKYDLPLAPATAHPAQKTALPIQRHDPHDIAQIRKREALAQIQAQGLDPAAHLRKQTAGPFLYGAGYLLSISAGVLAFQDVHHLTPIVLLALALAIVIYIAIRKPRSRHHSALIFIFIFLTATFGGLHYAPLFKYGP